MISESPFLWAVSYVATLPRRVQLPAISGGGVNWTSWGFLPLDEMLTSNCGHSDEDLNKRGIYAL